MIGNVSITSPGGGRSVKSAELLLYWRTSGIGDKDENILETIALVPPGGELPSVFARDFMFTLPPMPWSYAGRLIKINWYVGVFIKAGWMKSAEVETLIEVRPASRPPLDGVDPNVAEPRESTDEPVEIFYDKDGRPVPPPLNI